MSINNKYEALLCGVHSKVSVGIISMGIIKQLGLPLTADSITLTQWNVIHSTEIQHDSIISKPGIQCLSLT